MSQTLPDEAKKLIEDRSYPTLTTLNPDGSPQSSLLWVTRDGNDLLVSTTRGRQKERNIARDPRVTVVVPRTDPQSGYLEVRGRAEVTEQNARELIDGLYNKYIAEGKYPWDTPDAVRVIVRVRPDKVNWIEMG